MRLCTVINCLKKRECLSLPSIIYKYLSCIDTKVASIEETAVSYPIVNKIIFMKISTIIFNMTFVFPSFVLSRQSILIAFKQYIQSKVTLLATANSVPRRHIRDNLWDN